jgi:glycine/D-amino acid oxidase-like deaminating enzyme
MGICPFCGGPMFSHERYEFKGTQWERKWVAGCIECGYVGCYPSEGHALEKLNRRTYASAEEFAASFQNKPADRREEQKHGADKEVQ